MDIMTGPYKAADLVSIGSIVENYRGQFGFPYTYIVIGIDRTDQWTPFLLRRIDAKSDYEYLSETLTDPGWIFVSA